MSFYNNPHFEKIKNTLMDKYMLQAQRNNLTNTRTFNLTGGSIRRQYEYIPQSFIQTKENESKNKIILSGNNVDYSGGRRYGSLTIGGNLWSDIGKFAKPVASAALDVAAPMAGMYLGGPVGATLAKGAREGVRAVTGFGKGRKKKELVGVGVYSGGAISGGCNGDMACLPCKKKMKGSAKSAGAKSAGARSGGKRMDLVKKIMKEKGYNLGQASKFIKENNLY